MIDQFRSEAIRAIETEIGGLFPLPLPLSQEEVELYRQDRHFVRGWTLRRHFSDSSLDVRVLLDRDFPYSFPRVALAKVPPPLTWPHVEDDGVLCLNAADARLSTEQAGDARAVLRRVLERSDGLLRDLLSGGLEDHFLDEFRSYWTRGEKGGGKTFRSLLTLSPGSRTVAAVRRKDGYLLGDTPQACMTWLNNLTGHEQHDYTAETAVYIWLERPPYPRQYPLRRGEFGLQRSPRLTHPCSPEMILSRFVA